MFKFLNKILDPRSPENELGRFYGKRYKKMRFSFGLCLIFFISSIFLLFFSYLLSYAPVEVDSYIVKKEGGDTNTQKIENYPEPFYSKETIRNWTANALINIFSLDFLNYESQIRNKRRYFTKEGWNSFEESFKLSNFYNSVLTSNLRVSAIPIKKPVLLQSFYYNSKIYWRLETDILLVFEGATGNDTDDQDDKTITVRVLISTVDPTKNYRGIGIQRISTK